jgi:hypothetical protein
MHSTTRAKIAETLRALGLLSDNQKPEPPQAA